MGVATISPRQLATTVVVAASDSKETWRASWDQTLGRYLQCDGTADQVEIEAAIAAVVAAGGGEVVLLDGTYTVTASIDITSSNVTLRGMGRKTIITTATDDLDILYVHGGLGTELTNIILRDFLVRGFETGAMNDIGIFLKYVDDSKLINIEAEHNGEQGINIENCDNLEVIDCTTYSNAIEGLKIATSYLGKIINHVSNANTSYGIQLVSSADCQLVAPTCNDNVSWGIDFLRAIRCTVVGATCDNNVDGLKIRQSDYCSVVGGQFNNNSEDGIEIRGEDPNNCDYNTIVGVVCTGNTQSGIEISCQTGIAQANKNSILGCQLLGNAAAITDGGTGAVTGHNVT